MQALGNYLLRSRIHAVLTISALTILSVFVSPLSYFISGAPVGLVALRQGPIIGLQVAAGSLVLIALIAMAVNVQPVIPVAFMIFVWLPVILCSGVLRVTQSQGLSVLCAGMAGAVFTAYIHLVLEHIQEWWQVWFERWKEYATSNFTAQQLEQVYEIISPLVSTFIISGFVISLITTLLMARWWQSVLFNPGGFRDEFYSLRLPRTLVFPTLLGLFVLLFTADNGSLVFRDVMVLILILYLYQGLSAVHGFIHIKGLSKLWLVSMYVLFFLVPYALLLFVTCVGIANACLGRQPERGRAKDV